MLPAHVTVRKPQVQMEPAKIETTPASYEVEVGGEVRLECKVTPERTVITWHRNNDPYFMGTLKMHPEEVRYSIADNSKDMVIRNAKVEDSGVFKCETIEKVPVAINHTLLVTQKPSIVNMTATNGGSVGEGTDLTLSCFVTASPVPTVIWSVTRKERPNERLTERDAEFNVVGNQYTMRIKNVKSKDAGQYYCYAINKLGSDQSEASQVRLPAVLNKKERENPPRKDADYEFLKSLVLWVSLEVTDSLPSGKPQVHVPRTVVNSDLKIEAVLQCVAHEEARPHIRWYKDGVLIEDSETKYVISTEGSHSNLTVSPSADGDFGTFTCEAENDYGTHNRSIELVQSPVVEDVDIDGPRMTWTVHSHQPLEEMEVQLKATTDEGEWRTLSVPVPEGRHHKYDISYSLEDKQLPIGEYLAVVKVKNSKSWGGSNEPVTVNIQDPQSLYIQTASVFRENTGGAHSIRPVYSALTTILMYLLVRML
ncbi:hypothetical protein SFRURICE_003336 [Spodoptera frugiperda]|nr:hypothetical protein SFRURICE_003336 [Spodoptera frugiperda]